MRDLVARGERVVVHVAADPAETEGVNTRVELAAAAAALRDRINRDAHARGRHDRRPGIDLDRARRRRSRPTPTIHPFTVLRGTTRVATGAEIGPHAVAIDAEIGADATVGPFCYLRPGTVLGARAKAGTFVEIKKSTIGAGHQGAAPLLHRRRGDRRGDEHRRRLDHRELPARPGQPKGRTTIGSNVRVAVDTMFVAPVTVGDDAWTAAGTVVTDDVPDNALAGFPPRQVNKEGRGGKRDD